MAYNVMHNLLWQPLKLCYDLVGHIASLQLEIACMCQLHVLSMATVTRTWYHRSMRVYGNNTPAFLMHFRRSSKGQGRRPRPDCIDRAGRLLTK